MKNLQTAELRRFLSQHPEIEARPATKYEAGKVYWCGYWGYVHRITSVRADGLVSDLCLEWPQHPEENGVFKTHMTPADRWDWELVGYVEAIAA